MMNNWILSQCEHRRKMKVDFSFLLFMSRATFRVLETDDASFFAWWDWVGFIILWAAIRHINGVFYDHALSFSWHPFLNICIYYRLQLLLAPLDLANIPKLSKVDLQTFKNTINGPLKLYLNKMYCKPIFVCISLKSF